MMKSISVLEPLKAAMVHGDLILTTCRQMSGRDSSREFLGIRTGAGADGRVKERGGGLGTAGRMTRRHGSNTGVAERGLVRSSSGARLTL